MKKTILLLFLITVFSSSYAQLKVQNVKYKVIASAQKDSVLIELGDSVKIKEPTYIGGSPLLIKKLNETLNFDGWKKKKAGTYTAYVTRNWDSITVTTANKKAKDIDLVAIAAALKKSSHLWSSYTVGDQAMLRYTFQIDMVLIAE